MSVRMLGSQILSIEIAVPCTFAMHIYATDGPRRKKILIHGVIECTISSWRDTGSYFYVDTVSPYLLPLLPPRAGTKELGTPLEFRMSALAQLFAEPGQVMRS